ncbi:hypothetical protein L210DRAFT_3764899 [Boletus edulis BED1]|uniref:P-loop containing nucleoside triphosphate hydrolase protein n=1 Tax=Boletus edulis BED1 TaxID=1328754 RepID=A0AAD4BGC5_BOLED|nr:hypothetical protein L210DRAFT_3764899 [Boletus edulis BED1]
MTTRNYQQEMLDASLVENIIIAQDTGSGKTHIAVLRMKIECDREPHKVSWFVAPTVTLCEQQHQVIQTAIGSVGLIHGGLEPKQWTNSNMWKDVLRKNRVIVSTPQVLLDALSHGYVSLGRDIGFLIFDEAHHANDNHPMNCVMRDFYFSLPIRLPNRASSHGPVREERPMILGLTASPMFGGNAAMAFRTLEINLDSVIRSPRQHRGGLEAYVHRPEFRHVLYSVPWKYSTCYMASKNFLALKNVAESMDIENDPYVLFLRGILAKTPPGPERTRLDQKLSKTILKTNSYTHKGIKDLYSAAHDICYDLGPWAADWYIQRVVEFALEDASPYSDMTTAWQSREKAYLIDHLKRIDITPVSCEPEAIENGISDKLRVFFRTLEEEKERAESFNELYSGIVFVTRRDAVLALAAVLEHHPRMSDQESFRVGCLLGSSDSSHRTAFLDITRKIPRQPQAETLDEFRSGEKNLIIATAVAEEGLDIQACGNVIRWDTPSNMASWAQSRGRARRKRSTFVLMFEKGIDDAHIAQFEQLERDMRPPPVPSETDDEFEVCEFKVESTGALLTLQAAVSHLNHFCSVLPNSRHTSLAPLYDIDPPDLPEGWHEEQQGIPAYQGPFGCTLTLPKVLPLELRVYTVERKYPSKRLAYQHVAFQAYLELYKAGLLNDHLLPLTSVVEPKLEEEVKNMLKDIEKRDGTASVTSQLNPWLPSSDQEDWWSTEIAVEGLPSLTLLTRIKIPALGADELPVLHHPRRGRLGVKLGPGKVTRLSPKDLTAAQESTRRLFWSLYGSRMQWPRLDFAYLFTLNTDPDASTWLPRRSWAMKREETAGAERAHFVNAETFASEHGYPTDLTWVREGRFFGKLYRFVGWHHEKLTEEEEAEICARPMYSRFEEVRVTYPLLAVELLPQRSNFLLPLPTSNATPKQLFLLAKYSSVELLSPAECEYSQIIPSILRRLETAMVVRSMRTTLFPRAPLAKIPTPFLTTAVTAPVSEDPTNYQRLETLGDAVLKFIVALNLIATKPCWHEGYLTRRKDHVVANSSLAKEAIRRSTFRWIIRTRFSPRRFKPLYLTLEQPIVVPADPLEEANEANDEPVVGGGKTRREVEELSTKMLADVVESLIGAAYLHGSFDLGVSCAQLFGLGLEWRALPECVEMALSRVEHTDQVSTQLNNVELMLGYTFRKKLLLVESLTHASYQYDDRTVSYERMEFLGDALLDMIVADFLYKYPRKTYPPHDIHIRKSAVVNTHFLAYICFRTSIDVDASMPGPNQLGKIVMQSKINTIRLFQCLQHSSSVILEDQKLTSHRYDKVKDEIEAALTTGKVFPWAALTRLQAPKIFSDMIESLIGAVYLDSRGDMDTVKTLLWKLGVLTHLDRIIRDDVHVLHPVSRLSMWASRQHKEIEYAYTEGKGKVICTINVEGRDPVSAHAQKRGHASKEEARFAAAEKAISVWQVDEEGKRSRSGEDLEGVSSQKMRL